LNTYFQKMWYLKYRSGRNAALRPNLQRPAMRLTLHSDYGLRALIYLAAAGEAGGTASAIAEAYGISEHHLRKVIQRLTQAGLVDAARGRGGGLKLARQPGEIGIGAVLRLTEPDFAMAECMSTEPGRCAIAGACGLQTALSEALAAWFAVLDRHTLADAIVAPGLLRQRLGLAVADR
jgi:Rrf2 family nitric oxide-sensitive transcriptional repressor